MITEDYCDFETAKLLKEKGFQAKCTACYHSDPSHTFELVSGRINYCNPRFSKCKMIPPYNAPTLQMAMKWLREEYKLHIITIPYAPIDRHPYHPGEADVVYIAQLFKGIIPIDEVGRSIIKLTHEQACEAAIKYCLENLINKKEGNT